MKAAERILPDKEYSARQLAAIVGCSKQAMAKRLQQIPTMRRTDSGKQYRVPGRDYIRWRSGQ